MKGCDVSSRRHPRGEIYAPIFDACYRIDQSTCSSCIGVSVSKRPLQEYFASLQTRLIAEVKFRINAPVCSSSTSSHANSESVLRSVIISKNFK